MSPLQVVSVTPFPSGRGILKLPLLQTVLHELLQYKSFPQATVLYKLLHCGSVLCDHKSWQEICSSMDSYLQRSTGLSKNLVQFRLPTGLQSPVSISLLQGGVLQELQVNLCSPMDLVALCFLLMVFTTLLWCLEHPLLLILHWPCCLQSCFSHIFSLFSSLTAVA